MNEWQLDQAVDAIVFDCDGTLSQIEGIDELAKANGVGPEVMQLTQQAMDTSGITNELYSKRLQLVKPSRQQLLDLAQQYYDNLSPHAERLIQIYQQLGKAVYIISAGLNPAVKMLASLLAVSEEQVFAVDVMFDDAGNYANYDTTALTSHKAGKRKLIQHIQDTHPRILLIGDGMNDYEAHDVVTRFVGYGGAYYRKKIAELAHFYIQTPSLLSLLPLSLTDEEATQLVDDIWQDYTKGMMALTNSEVLLKN